MSLRRLLTHLNGTLAIQNLTTLRWDEYRLEFEYPKNGKPGATYAVVSRLNGATGGWSVIWKIDLSIVDACLQRLAGDLPRPFALPRDARKAA